MSGRDWVLERPGYGIAGADPSSNVLYIVDLRFGTAGDGVAFNKQVFLNSTLSLAVGPDYNTIAFVRVTPSRVDTFGSFEGGECPD